MEHKNSYFLAGVVCIIVGIIISAFCFSLAFAYPRYLVDYPLMPFIAIGLILTFIGGTLQLYSILSELKHISYILQDVKDNMDDIK